MVASSTTAVGSSETTDDGPAEVSDGAGFCEALAAVEQDAMVAGQRITDASDPVSGLIVSIAGLGDLRTFIVRLESVAPSDIAVDLAAIAASLDVSNIPLTDPVAAMANAVVGGLSVGGSYQRVDAYAVETCGRPVFGDVSVALTIDGRDQLPRQEGDLWYLRSTNFYGQNLCEQRSSMGVDSDTVVIACGNRAFGIQLPELAMVWAQEFDGPPIETLSVNGGRAALIRRESLPAEGLNPPTWRARITMLDVITGETVLDSPINGEGGVLPLSDAEDQYANIFRIGALDTGTIVLGYDSNFSLPDGLGSKGVFAFDSAGNHAYTLAEHWISEPGHDYRYAVATRTEQEEHVVDLETGDLVAPLPEDVFSGSRTVPDRCSAGLNLGNAGGRQWFYDPATDDLFSIPRGLVRANGYSQYLTDAGILVLAGNEMVLADRSGNIIWDLPNDVLDGTWWVDGHLVAENRAGDLIQVNISDGSDAGAWTYRDKPPFKVADEEWHGWESTRGDTIFTRWSAGPCGVYG